jgi:hypothetical protein
VYRITAHARQRIRERRLPIEWLVAALDGRCYPYASGLLLLCDPRSRCAVVVNPENGNIVTAIRLKPAAYKRMFSRGKVRRMTNADEDCDDV